MKALTFNAGILFGLVLMFAGAWNLVGFWRALFALGAMVWISTFLAARVAIAMRGSGGA